MPATDFNESKGIFKIMSFTKEKINILYRHALSLTHNHERAQDLTSQAIEKVLGRAFVLNKMAYAKTCIRNKFYDNYKEQKRYTDINDEQLESNNSFSYLEELVINSEELEGLLAILSPPERELLYMWAVEEHTLQEISDITKTPRGTLTSRLSRLKTKLKNKRKELDSER